MSVRLSGRPTFLAEVIYLEVTVKFPGCISPRGVPPHREYLHRIGTRRDREYCEFADPAIRQRWKSFCRRVRIRVYPLFFPFGLLSEDRFARCRKNQVGFFSVCTSLKYLPRGGSRHPILEALSLSLSLSILAFYLYLRLSHSLFLTSAPQAALRGETSTL